MAMQMLRPNAGQAQPQSFQQQPQQQQPQGEKPMTISPLTIHPDLTLDQNTKILTVGQGEASIFGQKYTLPALPFKLPATPALNSLQSLYPSEPCPVHHCVGRLALMCTGCNTGLVQSVGCTHGA